MSKIKKFTFFSKSQILADEERENAEKIKALEGRKKEEKDKREDMILEELRQLNIEASGKTEQYDRGKMKMMMIIGNIIKFSMIAILFTSFIVILIEVAPKVISFIGKIIRAIFF